jgi:hypothetical protein
MSNELLHVLPTLPVIHPNHSHRSRAMMPQVEDNDRFLLELAVDHRIQHSVENVQPSQIKPTQNEINLTQVFSIIEQGYDPKRRVLVTEDNYIFDGHHRWYATHVLWTKTPVVRIHASLRRLLKIAQTAKNTSCPKDINYIEQLEEKALAGV